MNRSAGHPGSKQFPDLDASAMAGLTAGVPHVFAGVLL
jgi:hypothetical protein